MAQAHQNGAAPVASVDLPPEMAEVKSKGMDDLLKEMNRMPLFMTSLDETDGEGGMNEALEALRAMAYEGTRAEIAENFRQQGNECARAKQWSDAKEFYNKAIAALKGPQTSRDPDAEGPDVIDVEVDEQEEAKKERAIGEAVYVNRALCNLEKKNYRSCIQDCVAALHINPSNVKAFYRSATAGLELNKLDEAAWACNKGLSLDPANAPLKALKTKIDTRKKYIESVEKARKEREAKAASERTTLALALKARNILTRSTAKPPDLEDATVKLDNSMDPSSLLSFPVILLYPMDSQSDFVKAFSEREKLDDHLSYIFPLPWDTNHEYAMDKVEAYMETSSGGLIKVGKKMSLGKVLGSGKPEIVDGLVTVSVVPKDKAAGWIEEFKKRKGKAA
ncbi:tetratricopeptide repeat protein 4 [Stemphylium lycopersici]|uniref:Tetratricopeptide repeat protein 4 n=1 Tax=Stemphylium lycopersici TaxID=183478 RepID=A0A364N877_STELY|nr:tetratricopeptide repeat protein 4 [Stemphylium lycopersici]RAR13499.1 tetratricopeptide repeat protein 4 [Stemphylium lycopersici]